ncbi:MAG: endonuclease/exonuclease/phosphatase family protein [Chitinophagaceae bacterium]
MKNLIKKCKLTFILFAFPLLALSQKEIKVMSYNIRLDVASDGENRWDARKDKVAGLMNFYEADFIGGQEVQHHQLKYLQENLNGYSYIGVGRDDGKEAGEYSCVFYKKEKFEVLQQSTFWLSPTPDSVSKGWDAAFKRVCTYGLFKDLNSKKKFWVLNTHFDHVGLVAREESAKLIIAKIKQLNSRKNYPVVLMGDFNSRPADAAIKYLNQSMLNARVVSKEPAYGPADTWNGFKFKEKPDGCIDYIFVSDDRRISITKFATLTDSYDMKYPSDHMPVLAVFLLKK